MKHYVKFFGFGTLIVLLTIAFIETFGRRALTFLIILAALFLLFIVRADAQVKADTVKKIKPVVVKPTFENTLQAADPVTYELKGLFNLQQANDYLTYESVTGPQLRRSKMPVDEFTRIETNHQLVSDSLKSQFGHTVRLWLEAKLKKFNADTTAKYHPTKK